MQGGGPNNMSFGPQVHFFLLLFVLFTNNMFSLIRIYTNNTHHCKPLLAGWWIPYPAAYETTAMSTSNCSQGGPSFVPPGAGGVTAAPWPSPAAMTGPRQHCHEQLLAGWIPTPSPNDDDNDLVSSSSSAPVLEGARNCRSSQMQELHNGRRWVYPYLTRGS